MKKLEQKHILRASNYSQPYALVDGYVEFIGRFEPYHWFTTFTFKDDIPNFTANKIVERFMNGINEDLYGRRFKDKGLGLPYIKARERQKRGTPHFHLLVGGDCWKLKRMKYKELWEGWDEDTKTFTRYGMARIFPYDRKGGARRYVSKYCIKGGEIDVIIPLRMYEKFGLIKSNNLELQFLRA